MSEGAPVLAVGAIVFDPSGRVLLVQRGKPPGEGLWSLPGGRVEAGESLATACVREVQEECGLAIELGPLVELVERIGHAGDGRLTHHFVIADYLGHVIGGELAAGSDARAARFVDDDERAALPTTSGLTEVIARARRLAEPG